MKHDISWMIGGPQGTGVDSSATLFARACAVAGYWVNGKREYHSNIKGEHSYFLIRTSTKEIHSNTDPIHLLATFEDSTAQLHAFELVDDGAFIYNPKTTQPDKVNGLKPGLALYPIDYDALIAQMSEETGESVSKLAIMKNTISVAASLALLGIEIQALETALRGIFTGKKGKLVELNMNAAQKAYAAIEHCADVGKFPHQLEKIDNPPEPGSRILVNGAQAVALGKLKAGCRILTYYSITPAVDECIYLEDNAAQYGMMVVQAEDEIAALNMAIGAGLTGARASTATSGPGFSLMAEGTGWAAINEVPVVIFDYQRGGPSTGLPTRHEQGDLLFALHAGHGEFPRLLMAPGDMHESFEDAFNSFNFADRYQTPVVVLSDKAMANGIFSVRKFDESGLKIDRGEMVQGLDGNGAIDPVQGIELFNRFKITESGISPRSVPGTAGTIFWMTGDEHTEVGHITEEPEIRMPMHEKRMRKLDLAAREIPEHLQWRLYGPDDADMTIVSWGSTKGAILDSIDVLQQDHGIKANFLQIRLLQPFPTEAVTRILSKARQVVNVEMNFTSQLAQLIRMRTGITIEHNVVKYTGRPISQTELVEALLQLGKEKSEKVVLHYGV
jgi:2-oxoglutarate ferredoxin oxidoreductase subunit alpha